MYTSKETETKHKNQTIRGRPPEGLALRPLDPPRSPTNEILKYMVMFFISRKNVTRSIGCLWVKHFWDFFVYKTFLSPQMVPGSSKNS